MSIVKKNRGSRAWCAIVLCALAAAGCREQPLAPVDEQPGTEPLQPGIHPVLVLQPAAADTVVVQLHFKRVQVVEVLGSFQGEINYVRDDLTFVDATGPAGLMVAWNEARPGAVRVAGAAPSGLPEGALVSLRFIRKGDVNEASFTFTAEELVSSSALANVTARVVVRDHPLFTVSGN